MLDHGKMSKIAIIILNWNGKNDTLACLRSLERISCSNFETLVVDNGSVDDSVAAIRAHFPQVTLIATGENLGFAEGNNVGIREALARGAERILLLNNDTVVDPDLLHHFEEAIQQDPRIGILGAKAYLFDAPHLLDHFGGLWNPGRAQFDLVGYRAIEDNISWEQSKHLDYACGCALFVKREVFEAIGLLEPKFFLIWEEADFCFRARRAGFFVMSAPQAKILHKVSASFKSKPHSTYFWWRNRLLWIERNCSRLQKLKIFLNPLLPEILNLYKLKLLKSIQFYLFPSKQKQARRLEELTRYSAALRGVKDYCLRRFGNRF